MRVGELILGALSSEIKTPDGEEGPGPEPLGLLKAVYPNFAETVRGRRVLDFGCGYGNESGALVAQYGAKVTGVDIDEARLAEARRRYPKVHFVSAIPADEQYDVVISQNAMEHFPDPADVLRQMKNAVAPEGHVLITFGPPWWHPFGSHMLFFCRMPWLQLWFSERTIMNVRARYRDDGAKRFGECVGGLNQMSLRKFSRLIRESGFHVKNVEYAGVRHQHWLTRLPIVKEFFTAQVTTVLAP